MIGCSGRNGRSKVRAVELSISEQILNFPVPTPEREQKRDEGQRSVITEGERSAIAEGDLPASVLAAVVYADLFDYPLTTDELARYQVGTSYSRERIAHALRNDPDLQTLLVERGGLYSLRDRPEIAGTRVRRARSSRRIWRKARRYTWWAARMPFVRMVAVTGALAVDNIGAVPDIDLLVVARDGRVWLCRRALILCVRLARLFGDDLCPNYIVSEADLELDQRDFYTAHELAQMVPVTGEAVYRKMLGVNAWAARYLPSAFASNDGPRRRVRPQGVSTKGVSTKGVSTKGVSTKGVNSRPEAGHLLQRAVERLLSLPVFDRWERWELRRLQTKLRPVIGAAAEVACSPSQCKGHTGLHRQNVMVRYRQRLGELGLDDRVSRLMPGDGALSQEG
jgi:hypothetical protein